MGWKYGAKRKEELERPEKRYLRLVLNVDGRTPGVSRKGRIANGKDERKSREEGMGF